MAGTVERDDRTAAPPETRSSAEPLTMACGTAMGEATLTGEARGTAVLVTGAWSPPEDWCFVAEHLRRRDIAAVAVDLPSNRFPDATRDDDVAATRRAITQARPPVIVVGWSYGGPVISDAAADQRDVIRLIYVASVPHPAHAVAGDEPPTHQPDISHVLFPDERTCVLDDQWWLTDGVAATLPEPVMAHLWTHRRRPMSLAALLGTQQNDAWRTIATTVLLGRDDELVPGDSQDWARAHFDDARIIDSDHFVLFRAPEIVAGIVAEAIERHSPRAEVLASREPS